MFIQLSFVFLIVLIISIICRSFNQPLVIAYIIAGILVSNFFLTSTELKDFITPMAEIGVAFMLFIVGIELKLKTFKEISKLSLIIGVLQEILTIFAGILFALLIGFNSMEAIYLGIALSFSSTILMVKLISDKGDLEKFYGKLAVGFLLVQDLITVLIIIILPFFSLNGVIKSSLELSLILALILLIPAISYKFLPKFENFLASSQELLFIFAVAFALLVSSIFKYLGVGLEIGALIAGISLSSLKTNSEIASRLRPVRDFFFIIFFVYLGFYIFLGNIANILLKGLLLSLFVILINPLIMFLLVNRLKITTKSAFFLSLTSGQISEFSFILIGLGIRLGHISGDLYSTTALVGLITFLGSTYVFSRGEKIYEKIGGYLPKKEFPEIIQVSRQYHEVILFGCDRIGYNFLKVLEKLDKKFLIIDYNLEKVKELERAGFKVLYGDASEIEFLNNINFSVVKIVISTIPEFQTNLMILREYRKSNPDGIFISTAYTTEDALNLYKNGSDYVITPHFLGGEHASYIFNNFMFDKEAYSRIKNEEIFKLQERIKLGHKHPKK